MAKYPEGMVLTCTHGGCNCRVIIEAGVSVPWRDS